MLLKGAFREFWTLAPIPLRDLPLCQVASTIPSPDTRSTQSFPSHSKLYSTKKVEISRLNE